MSNRVARFTFVFAVCLLIVQQSFSGIKIDKQTLPVNLKTDYRINPIGIDNLQPQLSWQVNSQKNNWQQAAFQVIVSTSLKGLTEKKCDVWNSGVIAEGESVGIPYSGPKLIENQRYYWKVRVVDQNGNLSQWSEPAFWEIGIIKSQNWSAKWISHSNTLNKERDRIRWIWLDDQDATNVPRNTIGSFRIKINFDELPRIVSMQTVARGNYELYVNEILVDKKEKAWQAFERQDLLQYMQLGENIVEVKVTAQRTSSFNQKTGRPLSGRYAAFAGLLSIESANGESTIYPTSCGKWLSKSQADAEWTTSKVVGKLDESDFGLDPGPLSVPASLYRKEFDLKKKIESARLYVTAFGSYRMFLNGYRVGDEVLTPEFTNYNKRLIYQTYDITASVLKGKNAVGAILGDGWYGSPLGWNGESDLFSSQPNSLLAEIHITYKDGTVEKILTDETWKTHRSPILKSEIYSGEYYDARLEQDGWNVGGFDDTGWQQVDIETFSNRIITSQINNPVKVIDTIAPVEIIKVGEQRWILDMGQNLVGWVTLKVQGEKGTVVKMRFAEVLKSQDSLYVDNLRGATATNSYVLNGRGEEVYSPYFTFQGFRYVEVLGYPGELTESSITAKVVSSVQNLTGRIETSNELVNKMYDLGIWGQKGNFISVPTDCPQRDERLGYTGDGQVFWRTGTYNYDVAAFTHKWMNDIKDEQTSDGGFPNTAPAVPKSNRKNGAPGWEDAGIIVPWSSWLQYGDKSIVESNWDAMVHYMNYVEENSESYIRPGGFLGDWLAPDPSTPNNLISTGLWGMTAKMMAQMAHAIGKEDDSKKYLELKQKISQAFQEKFIQSDGTVGSGSQTSYAIALHTGMVPKNMKERVSQKLVVAIEARGWHVSTGFLGTPYLLFALSDNGYADVAYRLLLNETFPSWGYMIKNGATTWWEHWDSDKGEAKMNSYNHYAFGSVVEWIYRAMIGINADPELPGFKNVIISPVFDKTGVISHAKGSYRSVYGEVMSEWELLPEGTLILKINIPVNTSAKVLVPQDVLVNEVNDNKTISKDTRIIELSSGEHVCLLSFR